MVCLQAVHHVYVKHSLTIPGLILVASIDDEQVMRPQTYFLRMCLYQIQSESELADIKSKVKQLLRRVNRNSEPQASIESDQYSIQ
jgi:hypothetical protein